MGYYPIFVFLKKYILNKIIKRLLKKHINKTPIKRYLNKYIYMVVY